MSFSLSNSWTPGFYPQLPWKSINCRLRTTGLDHFISKNGLWSTCIRITQECLLENSRTPSKIYSIGGHRKLLLTELSEDYFHVKCGTPCIWTLLVSIITLVGCLNDMEMWEVEWRRGTLGRSSPMETTLRWCT